MFWGKLKEITKVIREVDVQDIVVPDGRIRQVAYDESLRSLAESIKEHGILEPILVRKDLVPASDVPVFHLVAGEQAVHRMLDHILQTDDALHIPFNRHIKQPRQ